MKIKDYIFHLAAYYSAWFCGILLAANNQNFFAVLTVITTVLLQVIWQRYIANRTQGLLLMMTMFLVLGTVVDTIFMKTGLIGFSANPFGDYLSPPWMSSLWLSFAITFYSLLESFFERYLLDSILSLISFPIAYGLGAKLHAAYLPYGYTSAMIIGLTWAILFPLLLKTYHALQR